ncbi:MAG TPA: endonuclease/exonuclease/phosphatase family protein [Pirellulales bacterium]|nr:endonuclease/exonuclease/phosphatase family protein [Pirellulales bacterium]
MERPRRLSRCLIVVGLGLAVGTLYYCGDQRRAVPAAVGTTLAGVAHAPRAARTTLRVATFNIHGGVGPDRRCDLERTASALPNDLDLVLLNEVHGPYFWQSAGQAQRLGELTGKGWLFAPTEQRWWHHEFGNAVLATADVAWWQRVTLPGHSRGYRNVVLMEIAYGGGTARVVATHLDRNDPAARGMQLEAAIDLFLALAEPVIFMGDLNTTADEKRLADLLSRRDVGDPLHDALRDGTPRHIDWILTRGLTTIDAGMVDNGASDHPLVWAELVPKDVYDAAPRREAQTEPATKRR